MRDTGFFPVCGDAGPGQEGRAVGGAGHSRDVGLFPTQLSNLAAQPGQVPSSHVFPLSSDSKGC